MALGIEFWGLGTSHNRGSVSGGENLDPRFTAFRLGV